MSTSSASVEHRFNVRLLEVDKNAVAHSLFRKNNQNRNQNGLLLQPPANAMFFSKFYMVKMVSDDVKIIYKKRKIVDKELAGPKH